MFVCCLRVYTLLYNVLLLWEYIAFNNNINVTFINRVDRTTIKQIKYSSEKKNHETYKDT